MSILGDIQNLITEHGSAAILREKVELLDLQRAQAASERDALATELERAKARIKALESEKVEIQAQLDARQRIESIGQGPRDRLPDESEKMLVLIANATEPIGVDDVIRHLRLPQARGEYFFDQLRNREFVIAGGGRMGIGFYYRATSEGREYLMQRGLL